MIRLLTRRYLLCFILALTSGASAAEAPPAPAADLQADPSLRAVIDPKEETFTAYVDELSLKTGKSLLVLGFEGSSVALSSFRNRPARDLLVDLAERCKATWRSHDGFLLLYPSDLERHDARPKARVDDWKELRRSVSGVFTGDLMGVVQNVGLRAKVALLPVGPGASRGAASRSFLPCTFSVRDRTLDEVMQALTVLTGDPWDYWRETHLLSFTGRSLSGEQRRLVEATIASVQLKRSVTASQRKLLDTDRGLQYSDLTLRQKGDFAAATGSMRARSGAAPEGLVLRRTPSAPHLAPDPFVEVYIWTPGGLSRLGSMRFF